MPWNILFAIPWVSFLAVWGASSLFTRKTVARESMAARLSYAAPLALGCMLIFSRAFDSFAPSLERELWQVHDALRAVALAVCTGGIAFAFWARATLGNLWSGNITLKQDHQLVQSGPYALARHPIYTGLSVALLGTVLSLGTVRALLGLALAIGSFIYKLAAEERLMSAHFSDQHTAYRARVKRLIPFIW